MTALEMLVRGLAASRFLRFSVVGGCGFIIDVSVFFLLHDMTGVSSYGARPFSILAAMICTWLGNRMLTFHDHAAEGLRAIFAEWLKFAATNTVGAILNYATFASLVGFAPEPFNYRYFALAAGTAVGLVFNFTLSKRVVFSARKSAI